MSAVISSSLMPRPATVVALIALLIATTGVAAAKPAIQTNKDEVSVVSLAGAVFTTSPGTDDTIPLNGASEFTFTQAAGEAVELIASVDWTGSEVSFCDVTTIVYADGLPLGARVDSFSNKGEVGEGSAIGGLAAPDADRSVTLKAFARENEGCDEDDGTEESNEPDTWHISLTVSLIGLRN